ncbi:hypothetical protein L0F63_003265 [Massospora cicadina]|nr:hypothetical protein L0F63_003265 [Massospora cicadina]
MRLIAFAALAVIAVSAGEAPPQKKAVDTFTPEKIPRNEVTAVNLTMIEACKQTGKYNITLMLTNNTGEPGYLYPQKLKNFEFTVKSDDSDFESIKLEEDNSKINTTNYTALHYSGSVYTHQNLIVPFKFISKDERGNINFTITSKCEHESKEEVLNSLDRRFPAPRLVSSATTLSASLML